MGKIHEWWLKGRKEEDPFDKYVSIFITYNMLYNLYAKTRYPGTDSSRDDRGKAIRMLELVSEPGRLVHRLDDYLGDYLNFIPIYSEEYWEGKIGIPISDALRFAYREGWAKETIELLLKWLYKVRCNLFHGDKDYDDAKQSKLLKMSSTILDIILSELVIYYLQWLGMPADHDLVQQIATLTGPVGS